MKKKKIYDLISKKANSGKKSLAVLIDPDEVENQAKLVKLIDSANESNVDLLLIGGSLLEDPDISNTINLIKSNTNIPVVLFPGNGLQICYVADAILFLSLISGRNPEYLIGQHVPVAKALKGSSLDVIPTGYILVDGGKPSSVSYMSFTTPIPNDKPEIIKSTALAGELLGLKLIYLEAGSGAEIPISNSIISKVKDSIEVPLIVGGGINTIEIARNSLESGADIIVVGNHLENKPGFLNQVSNLVREINQD